MSDNPYQSPESAPYHLGARGGTREDVRSVAKYQKGIVVCILVYLIAVVARFALPPETWLLLGLVGLVVSITGAVFVFLLAIKVYGTGHGIAMGLLSLVPLLGLFVLLVVNGKATAILKANGIKVGLLGANLSSI